MTSTPATSLPAAPPSEDLPAVKPSTGATPGREREVVVGLDGSAGAHAALLWAAEEARLRGVALRIVRTWPMDPPAAPLPVSGYAAVDPRARHAEMEVEDESAFLRGNGLVVSQLICEGMAEDVLVDASETAGLIVVGSRGRGSFRSLLLGSVSAHVASHAHCPVVVVPHPEKHS